MPKPNKACHIVQRELAELLVAALHYRNIRSAVLAHPGLHPGTALAAIAAVPPNKLPDDYLKIVQSLLKRAKGDTKLLKCGLGPWPPALISAVRYHTEEFALLLLANGADPNESCLVGHKALPDARYLKLQRLVQALEQAGATA
ncbi:MAG: hypothetical protein INF43_01735 [Alphaproteobacteria bacterium]|jgi:hypothetical protein|nr:hypothetical protein [Alphaproteobacteria bacterium]